MIRKAGAEDAGLLKACLAPVPCLGARMRVGLQLLCQNPRLPVDFYLIEGGAVLHHAGRTATLLGAPHNGEELACFLGMTHVQVLESDGWMPPAWQEVPVCAMRHSAPLPQAVAHALLENPPPKEVYELLAAAGTAEGLPAYDDFYADACVRRNHGVSLTLGVQADGVLVCSATAQAITGQEVYIADVCTAPAYRGKGRASAVVAGLCGRFLQRKTLLCAPELVFFYRRLGFETVPCGIKRAKRPNMEEQA